MVGTKEGKGMTMEYPETELEWSELLTSYYSPEIQALMVPNHVQDAFIAWCKKTGRWEE